MGIYINVCAYNCVALTHKANLWVIRRLGGQGRKLQAQQKTLNIGKVAIKTVVMPMEMAIVTAEIIMLAMSALSSQW